MLWCTYKIEQFPLQNTNWYVRILTRLFQDSELRESLRVETEPQPSRKTSTPSRIRSLFRSSKVENTEVSILFYSLICLHSQVSRPIHFFPRYNTGFVYNITDFGKRLMCVSLWHTVSTARTRRRHAHRTKMPARSITINLIYFCQKWGHKFLIIIYFITGNAKEQKVKQYF